MLEFIMKFFKDLFKKDGGISMPEQPKTNVGTPSPKPAETLKENSVKQKDIFADIALPLILVFEGGLSNHPADKGGMTNKGIIQKVYDKYRVDKGQSQQSVEKITDAEVADIYRTGYWVPSKCDQMGEKLSVAVFDTSVNAGCGRSIKTLQQAIGAQVDGVIGFETIEKLKNYDQSKLANDYMTKREDFYRAIVRKDPSQQVFLKGWLRRVQFLRDYVNGVKTLEQIKKEW
jgi:lysozyme family protein